MRAVDHERIAGAVATIVPRYFTEPVLSKLKRGSRHPDVDRFEKRRAHHHGRQLDIRANILVARRYYLQHDLSESAFHLGVAFHYVADATCPGTKDRREHSDWERDISSAQMPRVRLIKIQTPALLNNILLTLGKKGTPYSSLYTSIEVCTALLELTWRSVSEKLPEEEKLIQETKELMPRGVDKALHHILEFGAVVCFLGAVPVAIILKSLIPLTLEVVAFGLWLAYDRVTQTEQTHRWLLNWYGIK